MPGKRSFWMGGAAPAADSDGNIYVVSGNGVFDAHTNGSDFGDSFLKLSSTAGLAIADYFTPFNQEYLNRADMDLGSSAAVLLPDAAGSSAHRRLLISAGKEGRIYLLDRDQMGHFNAAGDGQIVQSLEGAIGPLYGGPAYFNNTVYFSASNDVLKAFSISGGQLRHVSDVAIPAGVRLPGRDPHGLCERLFQRHRVAARGRIRRDAARLRCVERGSVSFTTAR